MTNWGILGYHPTPTGADAHNLTEYEQRCYWFTPPFCWVQAYLNQIIPVTREIKFHVLNKFFMKKVLTLIILVPCFCLAQTKEKVYQQEVHHQTRLLLINGQARSINSEVLKIFDAHYEALRLQGRTIEQASRGAVNKIADLLVREREVLRQKTDSLKLVSHKLSNY